MNTVHPSTFIERATARFRNKITKTKTCWLWEGYKMPNGYGVISIDKRTYTAHRLMYQITFGPVLPTMQVCHHCDVRHCVNPDHLFLGTAQDNITDMVSKGRHWPPLSGAQVPCNQCGASVYRKRYDLQHRTKVFCNMTCQSHFMKEHPEWKRVLNKYQQAKIQPS